MLAAGELQATILNNWKTVQIPKRQFNNPLFIEEGGTTGEVNKKCEQKKLANNNNFYVV